jgi:trk system potassium uptake protein TrkA
MAVDRVEKRVNDALPLVTDAQIGNATSEAFLRSLGVDNYDVCFVTVGKDFQSSLEIVSLLKELGARKVVARAGSGVHRKFLLRNGADEVLYPEKQVAKWAAVRYGSDHILDYIELDDTHSIFEVAVPGEWNGLSIGQLDVRRKYDINIMAVKQNGKLSLSGTSETVLEAGQTMLVLCEYRALQKCFRV